MKLSSNSVALTVGALALSTTFSLVRAQTLDDPTRPPAALGAPQAAGSGPEASGLQSIIRSNHGKPAAIINGELVALGGHIGDSILVKIGEDSVTLKTATGRETLKLIPGVEKVPVTKGEKESAGKRKNPDEKVKR